MFVALSSGIRLQFETGKNHLSIGLLVYGLNAGGCEWLDGVFRGHI